MRRGLLSIAGAILAAGVLQGTPAYAQQEFFDQLAEPGERVELRAKRLPDGTLGSFNAVNDKDGNLIRFVGTGRVILRSSKLNLEANEFVYEAAEGVLSAAGNVVIDRPGIQAKSGRVTYDAATGEIRLTESPEVEQSNEKNRSRFTGMEQFVIRQLETGETQVQMLGGEEILCEVLPAESEPAPTPTPTPAPPGGGNAATPGAAPNDIGFAGLGQNVKIITRPRKDEPAAVYVSTTSAGEFGLFRAQGAVVLESEDINLRADLLEYDATKSSVEALYNVYIRQDNVEADCGRMVYDIEKNEIVLSVSPFVREQSEGMIKTISEMDSFLIKRNPDGTTSTFAVGGPDGEPRITWESIAPAATGATPTPTGPVEIKIESDEDVKNLRK